jgi:hypothetical protein
MDSDGVSVLILIMYVPIVMCKLTRIVPEALRLVTTLAAALETRPRYKEFAENVCDYYPQDKVDPKSY